MPNNSPISFNDVASIYIHVPFCSKKCPYCHFYKEHWDLDLEKRYVAALIKEIQAYGDMYPGLTVPTLFFGGGTPNLLRTHAIQTIMTELRQAFNLNQCHEITMEINPGCSSLSKIQAIRDIGINRLSVGTQSFHEHTLTSLGRNHTVSCNMKCIETIKKAGFTNFSVDIIYGTPNESIESLTETLNCIKQLNPPHVSTYALSIEPNTPFKRNGIQSAGEQVEINHYEAIVKHVKSIGLNAYELSNFSKPRFECEHNKRYWMCEPVIGLGPGAHSFFKNSRYKHPRSLKTYFQNPIPKGLIKKQFPKQSKQIQIENFLLCRLRLIEPFYFKDYQNRFNRDFISDFKHAYDPLEALKLIRVSKKSLTITKTGRHVLNAILETLLTDGPW